jgi:hypothetical protein
MPRSTRARPSRRPAVARQAERVLPKVGRTLLRAAGNRATLRLLRSPVGGRTSSTAAQLRATLPVFDPRLAYEVAGLTDRGRVRFGVSALFMPPEQQLELARHERVHSVHQQLGAEGPGAADRTRAESLATSCSGAAGNVPLAVLLSPAPSRLCFPKQQKPPWDGVWIGNGAVIGEVDGSTTQVRIYLAYEDLKIDELPEYQTYHCRKDRSKEAKKMVATMRKVAAVVDAINALIPANSEARVTLVAITRTEASGFRFANKHGLIAIETKEDWVHTAAHEGGHALLEHHTLFGGAKGKGFGTLALRVADLFVRLGATKPVPVPDKKFNKRSPPSLKGGGQPAGLVMVNDSLWAGSGGHSWDNAHEFFASAFAAFRREPELLKAIVKHYTKADPAIAALSTEMFAILQAAGDAQEVAKLAALPATARAGAEQELQRIPPTPDWSSKGGAMGYLIDPTTLPSPDKIRCP